MYYEAKGTKEGALGFGQIHTKERYMLRKAFQIAEHHIENRPGY